MVVLQWHQWMKKHFWLGLSVFVTVSHRKYGRSSEGPRGKVLEALWGFMQEIPRTQFKEKIYLKIMIKNP